MARFATAVEDSDRWTHIELRAGDIVISTPPKSGTTWMQGIISSLLWPLGDAPGTLHERSPWIDARFDPVADLVAQVEAMQHRRFFKTHSPATAIPVVNDVRYVCVYRNPADALVSWGNHRASFVPGLAASINELSSGDGVLPLIEGWTDDWPALFDEWRTTCNPITHLASWWPIRDAANVLLVHYVDLSADLDGRMRSIADFLGLDVPSGAWPAVVERCTFTAMRSAARAARAASSEPSALRNGADSFYFRGDVGRGARLLDAEILAAIDAMASDLLPADAEAWLRGDTPKEP